MKKRTGFLCILLCLALAASVLAGCGSSGNTGAAETTAAAVAATTAAPATTAEEKSDDSGDDDKEEATTKAAETTTKAAETTTKAAAAETTTAAAEAADTVEPVTLTVWLHEGYANNLNRWGVDPVSAYIKEKTGISLDISTGDGTANDDTKLTLLMSSNNLPDIVNVPKMHHLSFTLQDEGFVEDIENLARKYNAQNMIRLIDESNEINLIYNRFADGNYWGGLDAPLYVWPDYFVDKFTYENARLNTIQERKVWLVRQDIYEAEGSPDLSNIEDFVAFLKTIKDNYKDKNGNTMTPLGMLNYDNSGEPFQILYGSYSGIATGFRFFDDSVKMIEETPEFEETIAFANRMYRDGLLDQEMFTETYDQWRDKILMGNIGVMPVWYWHADGANAGFLSDGLDMYYRAIPYENTPKADGITDPIMNHGWGIGVGFGWRCNYIPTSTPANKQEAAIRFFDFMYSHEGQMLEWYGHPGEYYEPAEAWEESSVAGLQNKSIVISPLPSYDEAKLQYGTDWSKETGIIFWSFWNIHGYAEFTKAGGESGKEDPITAWNREQVHKGAKYDFDLARKGDCSSLAAADPAIKMINDSITQIKNKWMPKIVMASSEADARTAYNDMLAEMNGAGLQTINAAYDTIYNEKMLPLINR